MSEKPIAEDRPAPSEQEGAAQVHEPDTEAAAAQEAEEAGQAVEEDLDELTAAKRERDEYLELAQRTKADFDNYRKRVAKEASEALARGRAGLARDLIPVVDNLERAVDLSAEDPVSRGVALVLKELQTTLERAGVEAYDPAGEQFDPTWHEALSTAPAQDGKPGVVMETLERGYRLDGQVLRPARVVVSE